MSDKKAIKTEILEKVKEYYLKAFKSPQANTEVRINYAGRVFDENELVNLVDCSLDFWLTSGRYAEEFEKKLGNFLNVKYCSLTNSGSSANLLAFMALTSPLLKEKRVLKGSEIITVAAGFPTTVAPIIQFGAIPVFVDIEIPTYNISVNSLEKAISPKTKAVMVAHTLGNPFDLKSVKEFCQRHDLWLIEDNCDSLGSKYNLGEEYRHTGTFGDIGTSSFYPPHHITMGEGGAVYTNNPLLHRIVNSFRDWGRDCWCPPGKDNTCHNRFNQQFGQLPFGYDHKYVYSHFGYNLKVTDMQAAIGCAQLEKLPEFIKKRQINWKKLYDNLQDCRDVFIFPEKTENSEPSWFGFMLTVKNDAPFTRDEIVSFLAHENIQTRMLFAGNLIKHPCFDEIRNDSSKYRIIGDLKNTDMVMTNSFWVGVYPGLTDEMVEYMVKKILEFVQKKREIN